MSVATPVPELIWPPFAPGHGPARPAWDGPTRALRVTIPAPNVPGDTLTTEVFEPAALAETDRRVKGLGALLAAEMPLILKELDEAQSMTSRAARFKGDNSDAEGTARLGILPETAPIRIRTVETTPQGDIDPKEIRRRAGALAAFSKGRDRARAPEASSVAFTESVVIPGRTQAEQSARRPHVVGAEVARHRRPLLYGARLFMKKMVRLAFGGDRGRHRAPGRNGY